MKRARVTKLHWYGGEAFKGDVMCGKGTNRVRWTDQEDVWVASENHCPDCEIARGDGRCDTCGSIKRMSESPCCAE